MNILPMIFAFLFIFSCVAATFMKELQSIFLIDRTIDGYNRTERELSNAIVRKAYRKIQSDSSVKREKKEKKAKEYRSMRDLFPPFENSKFNLTPLIKQEGPLHLHPLYEPLASLLRILYKETAFKGAKEKIEYALIEAMLKKAKKLSEVQDLAELHPEEPVLKKVYYKMLKGTNQYSRDTGIPPLRHFLGIQKSEKAVFLSFASFQLLEALFSKKAADEILRIEQEKWKESNIHCSISKQDLPAIFAKRPSEIAALPLYEPYLDDSKQFETRDRMGGRDRITGIAVEKELK